MFERLDAERMAMLEEAAALDQELGLVERSDDARDYNADSSNQSNTQYLSRISDIKSRACFTASDLPFDIKRPNPIKFVSELVSHPIPVDCKIYNTTLHDTLPDSSRNATVAKMLLTKFAISLGLVLSAAAVTVSGEAPVAREPLTKHVAFLVHSLLLVNSFLER
ncbi:hypothetical protein C8J56DRAFT_1043382 [Mycena floridula]|nr:hypothetical protein C8J56DRAFT_1043382 [Mycena floridula]